ncbi:YbaB/EbfC DNA-binding family protein [Actinoplanes philippinensis]|uniref:YbaB/EbfC DNA-binding family protein n=1 Tax=Actinoplanes philippinensis TaxID=35752 RepID=A0A1I2HQW4_9ACTN|nr:YbaB/EbfC family nucleoid-associated protein [Actinoplanes philippinensis]SFF31237.1 YbaB/EbfC DNA-binding family protein [Actinoplanes philippinensis]
MPQDPEDLLADWQWRVQQRTEATLELSRRMERVDATARSADRDVTVTVDHSGGMTALALTEEALRRPPGELADLILATTRQAQSRLAENMSDLVQNLYGWDSPTTAFIADAYTKQFSTRPDDDRQGRDR